MVAFTILEAGVLGAAGAADAVCTIAIRGDSKGWSAVKRLEALHHDGQLPKIPGFAGPHVQANQTWPQGVASITSASIKCSGDVDLGVHPAVLHNATIEGVTPRPSCGPSIAAVRCFLTVCRSSHVQCLLTVCGSSRVNIVNSVIAGVDLTPGADAILCVKDQARVVVHNSTIHNNNASAIVAADGSHLVLTSSQVVHNTALVMSDKSGVFTRMNAAGVTAAGSARVFVQKRSRIDHNVAYGMRPISRGSFSAVREALTQAELPVQSSWDAVVPDRFGGYRHSVTLRFYGGGGLQVGGQATMLVDGQSSVSDNIALGGSCGGALVTGNGSLTVTGASVVARNEASVNGGGLCAEHAGNLTIQGSSQVKENICGVSGCGVWVFDSARAVIRDRVSISDNRPQGPDANSIYNASVRAGSVVRRDWQNHVAVAAVLPQCDAVCLSVRDKFRNVEGVEGQGGGGAAVRGYAFLHLEDVDVRGNWAHGTGGGVHAGEFARLVVRNTNFSVNGSNNNERSALPSDVAMVGRAYLQDIAGALTAVGTFFKQAPQPFNVCSPSFYSGVEAQGSRCCAAYSHQFGEVGRSQASNASQECLPCPANAGCIDNTVRSVEGFWHSSAQSTQIHRCPMFTDACAGGRDCKDGYRGNLCGVCAPGWGMTAPFKCVKCWPRVSQLLVYLALFCASLAAITYTVHATWADNKLADTTLRVTDLIKVLVQFLQYVVILGSVSTWPEFLRYWFVAASTVFGATELSLDCWVKQNLAFVQMPSAYTRQVIFFIIPLVMFALVILLTLSGHALGLARDAVARRGSRQASGPSRQSALQLNNRLWVAFLVVSFHAYPSIVKASLSYFACKQIDDAKVDKEIAPYPQFALMNNTAGYWALDANEACLAGRHEVWADALGLHSVLALCAGVPMWIWWFMRRDVPKADSNFKERFGFIYRNYREECCWWEAVWAVMTVLLTVVAVFHHNIGQYHAVLLMMLFLLLSAVVQQWQKPYAEAMLHHMHMLATTCLILSAWLALNMPSLTTSGLHRNEQAETAIGALILLINGMFVMWCVWRIVQTVHATWKPMQVVAGWLPRVCRCACVDPRDAQRG